MAAALKTKKESYKESFVWKATLLISYKTFTLNADSVQSKHSLEYTTIFEKLSVPESVNAVDSKKQTESALMLGGCELYHGTWDQQKITIERKDGCTAWFLLQYQVSADANTKFIIGYY